MRGVGEGVLGALGTDRLTKSSVTRNAPDAEARRRVLSQMDDFGPFWS
jgi:hypothetical protein